MRDRLRSAISDIETSDVGVNLANDSWPAVPAAFRRVGATLPPAWHAIFEPLRAGAKDDLMVVGQLGQSLDGRIATQAGHSHYINGAEGLAHLHRLRAIVDAVVVGVGTAIADDPQLTVRRVCGPNPARVVIDPRGRLPATARALADDGVQCIVIIASDAPRAFPAGVEMRLPCENGKIAPPAILASLAEKGFRRILIEGGADTVSRFLIARCLDRLHVVVAPIIFGSGRAALTLPPIEKVDEALRPPMRAHTLGNDVLFDCDLSGQRVPVGRANKST